MSAVVPPRVPGRDGGHIRALTGVRIVAAVWVVYFHIRGNLYAEFPASERLVGPLLNHGELGVDLFFALSGYVLALNYVHRLGPSMTRQGVIAFYWARLARIWPVYVVTLFWAAGWHAVVMRISTDPVAPRDFTALSFVRQFFLVAVWNQHGTDRLMWNGPAWSVSAEALAYTLFPIAALLLFRLGRTVGTRPLLVLAGAALFPLGVFVVAFDTMYYPWSWLLRILCYFSAGAVTFLIVDRCRPTSRQARWSGHLAGATIVVIAAWFYAVDHYARPGLAALVGPLFVVVIGLLAMSQGGVSRVLASPLFVTGGAASYSVYMVHMLIIEPLWWLQMVFPERLATGRPLTAIAFLLVPWVAIACGVALWRYVEEPARRAMRSMSTAKSMPRALPSGAEDHTVGKSVNA